MKPDQSKLIVAYKEQFPEFRWDKFFEIDRAVNWELWNGSLPDNYWTEVEPLEHYRWVNWERGLEDLKEMLDELPAEMFWDNDWDGLMENDPYDDESYWEPSEDPDFEGEMDYYGPQEYYKIETAKELLYDEVWKMI